MRALIIEDDQQISGLVRRALESIHCTVIEIANGRDGCLAASTSPYDVIILDLMLPDMDGLQVISELRTKNIHTPVLILSAKREVDDRISGLRAGGDDYLVKPFVTDELLARVEALVRRSAKASDSSITLNAEGVSLDLMKRQVFRNGQRIELQAKEFTLLEFLMRNKGHVVSKSQILRQVWDYEFDPQTNVVDVLLFRLRGKIDKDFSPKLIHTVRGTGYVFRPE